MDVLVLIDKLDDLVHNAKAVPLTDQVRIDREEIYDILDQMRATIPEEIKQARWIVKERQEMRADASGCTSARRSRSSPESAWASTAARRTTSPTEGGWTPTWPSRASATGAATPTARFRKTSSRGSSTRAV